MRSSAMPGPSSSTVIDKPGRRFDAVAPSAPHAPGVSNTVALGRVLYTKYLYFFQAAGMILLTAMVGAIVLTLRHKVVKRQSIPDQNARTQAGVVEIKKVPFRAGV